MTQNQLRYWELRWKQWYEYQLLQHEKAKLAETQRHNRVSERQKYEEITISREDLERQWAELDEKKRAAMAGEAIGMYKANIEAANVQSMIKHRLAEEKVAAMDLAISLTEVADKGNREWVKIYSEAAAKGWGQGVIGAAVGELRSSGVTQQYDFIANEFSKLYPEYSKLYEGGTKGYMTDGTKSVSNNGILAVVPSKSSSNLTPNAQNKYDPTFWQKYGEQQTQKQSAGVNYKTQSSQTNTISRDKSVVPSGTLGTVSNVNSGVISSKTTGNASPSTNSGPKSGGSSGVIITTNIHKGPGY